ncbi:MAG: Crp/Fnr family transcriptional regulator [Ghiorsea sp.]
MADIELKHGFKASDFNQSKELFFSKGDVFLYEGDAAKKSCYLLTGGQMDVRLISGSGHETLLYHLNVGDLVGELALFGAKARTATVVSNSKVTLLEIPSSELKTKMENREFLEKVTSHFLQRYLKTHEVVCRLGQPNIGMKLCHYFKSLAEQTPTDTVEVAIRIPSHVILSNLLSCQRESVTRELKKLVKTGVLKQVKGSDYILDITNVDLYLGDLLD